MFPFFLQLSGDAVHGDRPGEADEAAEAVRGEDSVFGLSDAQRAKGGEHRHLGHYFTARVYLFC